MGKLNLNSLFNAFNTSYKYPVEYSVFCQDHPELTCIDNLNTIIIFNKLLFNNFTLMSRVLANKNNYDLVETLFEVENQMQDGTYGESLVAYIDYLNDYNFNVYNTEAYQTDRDSYKYMSPNHLFVIKNVNYLADLLQQELLVVGLSNYILNSKLNCENFFNGKYADYAELCKKPETDLTKTKALRTYVGAYFFNQRKHFENITAMDAATASNFLRLDTAGSLFAISIQ